MHLAITISATVSGHLGAMSRIDVFLHQAWIACQWIALLRCSTSAFFVTVQAGMAYRKIWRLDNNFFARIIRLTAQKFQLFWVIFCIIIFHRIMAHFNFVISQNAKWGHASFYIDLHRMTSSKYAYRKVLFYKKSTVFYHLNKMLIATKHIADNNFIFQ